MSQVIPLGPAARMLTTREAALRLGVSLRTVQLWVEADILPAARTPGGHRRIPYNAVEALALSTGLGGDPLARGKGARRASLASQAANEQSAEPAAVIGTVDTAQAILAAPPEAVQRAVTFDVLLVADDPDWQARCQEALKPYGSGVQLRFAETGYLALLQIGQRAPDMLITHLDLPGMDGMAMLHTLERCEAVASHMRILVLTDCGTHELARRGGIPTSAEVLKTGITPESLAVRVGRHLLERRAS